MISLPDLRVPVPVYKTIPLTPRQLQILQCLAEGKSNRQIVRAIGISPSTIRVHIRRAVMRLGARNRTQAVARAVAAGYVVVPDFPPFGV